MVKKSHFWHNRGCVKVAQIATKFHQEAAQGLPTTFLASIHHLHRWWHNCGYVTFNQKSQVKHRNPSLSLATAKSQAKLWIWLMVTQLWFCHLSSKFNQTSSHSLVGLGEGLECHGMEAIRGTRILDTTIDRVTSGRWNEWDDSTTAPKSHPPLYQQLKSF